MNTKGLRAIIEHSLSRYVSSTKYIKSISNARFEGLTLSCVWVKEGQSAKRLQGGQPLVVLLCLHVLGAHVGHTKCPSCASMFSIFLGVKGTSNITTFSCVGAEY